MLYKHLL